MRPRGEILYWFRITTIPTGGAPENVRAQWVGTLLPVRRPPPIEGPEAHVGHDVMDRQIINLIPDGVEIARDDVLKALRLFDRGAAAAWWSDLFGRRPLAHSLVFRRHEGELLPVRMAELLYPELEGFDELDP